MHSRASIENQSLTWQPLFWHHHPNKMLWIKGFWWFSSECYLLFEFNVFLNVFLVLILGTYCSIPFLFLFPSRTNFQSYIFQAFSNHSTQQYLFEEKLLVIFCVLSSTIMAQWKMASLEIRNHHPGAIAIITGGTSSSCNSCHGRKITQEFLVPKNLSLLYFNPSPTSLLILGELLLKRIHVDGAHSKL